MCGDYKYDVIIFDMDGTLLNTKINYSNFPHENVLSRFIIPNVKKKLTRKSVTNGNEELLLIFEMLNRLESSNIKISEQDLVDLVNKESAKTEMSSLGDVFIFDGVEETLSVLKEKGIKIGLLTRAQRIFAESAIRKAGLFDFIDSIEAYDDHQIGEQKPNPTAINNLLQKIGYSGNKILCVGDGFRDYLCAKRFGVDFIGIGYDENKKKMWTLQNVNFITDMIQLLPIVKR